MAKDNPLSKFSKQAAKFFSEEKPDELLTPAFVGQLAIDVYQTPKEVIVRAPIAGVNKDNIEVTVADDMITVRGERKEEKRLTKKIIWHGNAIGAPSRELLVCPLWSLPRKVMQL